MSTYLSPILSSGDSTPAENVQSAPSAAENATEFPVRKFKVQTNQQQEENSEKQAGGKQQSAAERRAKTRLRSMGNSMLRDELSDGDIGDEEIDQDDSDEENYQSDRLRFASNLQNYLTNNNNNNSNKTNTQAQKSTTNKATTAQGVHQCLADQFRSMTARGSNSSSGSGKGEARSSSVSSEGELLSGGAEGGNQFRKLFKSAASNQRRLNKKVKQILQSIPVMPLVATTSVMTIILLSLLLLGDSLHVATAARSPPAPLEPQALSGAGDKQDQPDRDGPARMQSLVMEPARESPPAQAESANFGSANNEQRAPDPDPDPAQLSNLRRELIGSYLAQRQQLPAKAEQHAQVGSERRPTFRQLLLLREQQDHQAKSKRRHHQQAAGGDSGSGLINSLGAMLFGASANQQQSATRQPEGESQAETAELSGPARDEEETLGELEERGRESAEQQAAGFMLDGEPPAARATATSHHHHQPAHLRSSTLELELSPEAQTVSQPQRNPNLTPNNNININKQPARARPSNQVVSLMRQQHINRHPFQREPPPKTPMGRQRQPAMFSGMNHPAFDLPQIECNNTAEGFERFACPTPNEEGKYRCIEDVLFCDGYYDCPHGEDEERTSCMYYRLFVSHIDILTNTFLTWMKSQNRQAANNHHANQHSHRQHLVDELDTA